VSRRVPMQARLETGGVSDQVVLGSRLRILVQEPQPDLAVVDDLLEASISTESR
jgi:hypothetical protein